MEVGRLKQIYSYSSQHDHVATSLDIIEQCLTLCNNDINKLCISFNGGKDCTVLLELLRAVMTKCSLNESLNSLYIKIPDTFKEMEEFVSESIKRYDLKLLSFDGPDFRKALKQLKESNDDIKYIMMGTRSGDISYPLASFQKTDDDWPEFIRVSPLLNWTYHDIWHFLRQLSVPYCVLYDMGYTSIGSRCNTLLNPKLMGISEDGKAYYLPAYTLPDSSDERYGRIGGS